MDDDCQYVARRASEQSEQSLPLQKRNDRDEHPPLFPRMKASPYLFFNCPLTYSCENEGTK